MKKDNNTMYSITEQGDLGLGLNPIHESINYDRDSNNKNKKDKPKNNNDSDLY